MYRDYRQVHNYISRLDGGMCVYCNTVDTYCTGIYYVSMHVDHLYISTIISEPFDKLGSKGPISPKSTRTIDSTKVSFT